MFKRGVWRRGSQILVALIILQSIVTGAFRRDDVRHHLRSWIGATPTLWGRTLVLQLRPVSLVQQGSGPAVLDTDAPQHTLTIPHPVPTALHVSIWAPDQSRRALGLLGDAVVPLDLLTTIPLGLLIIALAFILGLQHARVKPRLDDQEASSRRLW